MNDLQIVKSENFGAVKCDFWEDGQNQIYLTRQQVGQALGYGDPQKAIDNIHQRHLERLNKFSVTLTLRGTDGKQYNTTVYEPKGVYEICRWSRQPKANAFMDWVWDVLETIRKTGTYSIAPYPAKATSVSEVVKLLYVVRAAMKDQRSNPRDVAKTIKEVCDQFSIHLPDYFIKPETAPKTIQEVTDMMDFTFTRPDPTYEGYLTFCPRPKE